MISAVFVIHTGSAAAHPSLSRVRFLIVADHFAARIGDSVVKSQRNLEHFLNDVFFDQDVPQFFRRATIDRLGSDHPVTPDEVLGYYEDLDVADDDVLCFYYIGHGGYDYRLADPILTMSGGDLRRSTLRNAMIAKSGGRLRMLITDMCSSPTRFTPPLPAPAPALQSAVYRRKIEDLFFRHRGTLDFTAAYRGEFGWAPPGGTLFTGAFVDALMEFPKQSDDGQPRVTYWGDVIAAARASTERRFQQLKQAAIADGSQNRDLLDQETQSPWALAYPRYSGDVSINALTVRYDSTDDNGQVGSDLAIDWEAMNMQGENMTIVAYVKTRNGSYLMDRDGQYASRSGRVAIWEGFKVPYPKTRASTRLFLPDSQLDLGQTDEPVYLYLVVELQNSAGQTLDRSRLDRFRYTRD